MQKESAAMAAEMSLLNDSNEISAGGEDGPLNLTNISDVLAGGNRDTLAKAAGAKGAKQALAAKGKKRDNMYQFV